MHTQQSLPLREVVFEFHLHELEKRFEHEDNVYHYGPKDNFHVICSP